MKIQENSTLVMLPESEYQSLRYEVQQVKEILKTSAQINTGNQWFSKKEAALKLDVSTKTLDKYFKSGVLSYSQFKGKIYVKSEDIEAHLQKYYIG